MEAEEPTDAHKNQRETDLLRSVKPLPHESKADMARKHTEHPQSEPKKKLKRNKKWTSKGTNWFAASQEN